MSGSISCPTARRGSGYPTSCRKSAGKISFLNLCDEDEYYQSGEVIGDAEAFKGVWDISAPISGTVLRINDDLLDDPQSINSDPYGSWLAEFCDAERGAKLMTAQEYCKYLGKEAEMI